MSNFTCYLGRVGNRPVAHNIRESTYPGIIDLTQYALERSCTVNIFLAVTTIVSSAQTRDLNIPGLPGDHICGITPSMGGVPLQWWPVDSALSHARKLIVGHVRCW